VRESQLFVHDPDERLPLRLNAQLVEAQPLDEVARARLRALLERHLELTGSERAAALLADWEQASQAFRVVRPRAEIARIEAEAEGTASGDPDADPAGEAVAV